MNETTVLVVEDDESLRTLFGALLRRHGCVVVPTKNGAEALELLATRAYDVVVLDLMMPVCNGFDVLRYFSESAPALLRRTIVTTGVADKILNSVDRDSVYAVIRKPFDIDELVATIRACAGSRDATLHHEASRRFDAIAPALRKMLGDAPGSYEESALRYELRNVVSELGTALDYAAVRTADAVLALGFARMATTAREVAATPPRRPRREH